MIALSDSYTPLSPILVVLAGTVLVCSTPVRGGGSTIEIHVDTPCCPDASDARGQDILLQSVVSDAGVSYTEFIFASSVSNVQYAGAVNKFSVITGHESVVGDPGVFAVEDEDGNGASISSQDLSLCASRILNAWNHENINAYINRRSNADFSCEVEFSMTIDDNDPGDDDVGELIIFEVSGNSWLQIEAIDDDGVVLGQPLVVGNYSKIAPHNLYTTKYKSDGSPTNGKYELKAIAVDLSDLGVTSVTKLRVRSPEHPPGGGDIKACFRVVGVKTCYLPTAVMVFD